MGKALVVLTMGWALSARTAPMSPLADTVRRMTADSWWSVPNSRLDQSPVAASIYLPARDFDRIRGVEGLAGLMTAWNGGAYDGLRNRLLVFGGGHNDYYGNEIYAFNLNSMAWERVTNPTLDWANGTDPNPDGTANSRHSYNAPAYLSHTDQFFVMGGALNSTSGGCGARITWVYDFSQSRWLDRRPSGTIPRTSCENSAVYDPQTRKVWWADESSAAWGLYSYDVDANRWTHVDAANAYYGYTMAVDTRRGLLFLVGGSRGDVQSYDIRGGSLTRRVWTTTGGNDFLDRGGIGLDYDPVADRLVGWGNGAVYDLKIDAATSTGVWTRHAVPGAPVTTSNGVYGRWRYVPTLNAFVLAGATNENVHFFKLTSGAGDTTPPTVSLTAPPPGATVSGTVTVSAAAADDVGVAGVQFRLDGAALGAEDTSSPYSIGWDSTLVPGGAHVLSAVARDAAGNTTTSAAVAVTVSNPPPPPGDLPAFPGAEGWGTETPAGRGTGSQTPRVYVVTNKNASGPGSFMDALRAQGPRFIVFRVSGVIDTQGGRSLLTGDNSYVTIAGQTSPGGVTLTSSYGDILTHYQEGFGHAVFRFLRFRATKDNNDGVSLNQARNVVFDHCDFSGASDETLDLSESSDITVQWSQISNSSVCGDCATRGFLVASYAPGGGHHFSIHHNLMAHHSMRFPEVHWAGNPVTDGGKWDYRNNVAYNGEIYFLSQAASDSTPAVSVQMNVVGNYFKAGPDTPVGNPMISLTNKITGHASDNIYFTPAGVEDAAWVAPLIPNPPTPDRPFAVPPVTTQAVRTAYDLVLSRAGAFPRDEMSRLTVEEVRRRTGSLGGRQNDPLLWATGTPPEPLPDADLDGLPDDWERARGLNPNDRADSVRDRDGDGYLNIEEYINELANARIGAPPPVATSFYPLAPCRVVDTRGPAGPQGGPALVAGADRLFPVVGRCGIPPSARALAVNVTVAAPSAAGHLRLYPAGTPPPSSSVINYSRGRTRANNAIVGLDELGKLAVYCAQASGTAHLVLDVTGYFR